MNTLEMVKKHIEFSGYEFDKNNKEDFMVGFSEAYGGLIIRPLGEDGCFGVRLEKYYPINLQDCNNTKKSSLYKMVNEINRTLISGTVFVYDDKGMTMSFGCLGNYDKKMFSNTLNMFHADCDKMYDFDLDNYWGK